MSVWTVTIAVTPRGAAVAEQANHSATRMGIIGLEIPKGRAPHQVFLN